MTFAVDWALNNNYLCIQQLTLQSLTNGVDNHEARHVHAKCCHAYKHSRKQQEKLKEKNKTKSQVANIAYMYPILGQFGTGTGR